jgi:hypothetical protein
MSRGVLGQDVILLRDISPGGDAERELATACQQLELLPPTSIKSPKSK